ncbi:hypothetical protein JXA47_01510 [Candidatus Sumerlaeota bacterium]|nr:hypothetical protein [Candidatus Sumerlaeota bacterium]
MVPAAITYVVDDPGDPTPNTGILTLRQALASSESDGVASIINFSLGGPTVITLNGPSGTLPALTEGQTWIQGPGADQLEIDGIGLALIFDIQSSGNAISGISMHNTASEQILVQGGASNNWVWGCRLGMDMVGNPGGVLNTRGVRITGTGTDGNLIGTDGGSPPSGNVSPGGASNEAERNVISNHTNSPGYGVEIADSASANRVAGNFIGTSVDGLSSQGNSTGVAIGAGCTENCIGVSDASAPTDLLGGGETNEWNLISGNSSSSVSVRGSSNWISGNLIGTDVTGNAALGGAGIRINSIGSDNVIGTDGDNSSDAGPPKSGGEQNVISGTTGSGVLIEGNSTTVAGNHIGIDLAGMSALPNATGVRFVGAGSTLVGTNADGVSDAIEGNIISGNTTSGITFGYAVDSVIWGNVIGLNASQTGAIPNGDGIWAGGTEGSSRVSIGVDVNGVGGFLGSPTPSSVMSNVISGNTGYGIQLRGDLGDGSRRIHIMGNFIGTDATGTASLGNGADGIHFGWAYGNVVGHIDWPNVIAHSGGHGILVDGFLSAPMANTFTANSIHSNAGLGIENANGGNGEITPPTITAFDSAAGTISGTTAVPGTVEVFADTSDEGRQFLGRTYHPFLSPWTVTGVVFAVGPSDNLTATVTDASGNTSEFGLPLSIPVELSVFRAD